MEFEQELSKLQDIVKQLDSEQVTLKESLALFEKGVKLSNQCMEILAETKGKITILKQQADALCEQTFVSEDKE